MAGGKETPRQKMIGMMYLVLTALLALNVSKSILDAFVNFDVNITEATEVISEQANASYNSLKELATVGEDGKKQKAKKWLPIANKIVAAADKRIAFINQLRDTLLYTLGEDLSKIKISDGKNGFTYLLDKINANDNYDVPMQIMVGADIKNPDDSKSGMQLWNEIHAYRNEITQTLAKYDKHSFLANKYHEEKDLALANVHANDRDVIERIFNALTKKERSDMHGGEIKNVHWVGRTFDHAPSVAAMAILSSIEQEIITAESIALRHLSNKIGGSDFTFNKVVPLAYAASNYYNSGDSIKLNVMMAAYDSYNNPDVSFSLDSSASREASKLIVKDGQGIIGLKATGTGLQVVNGTIKVKKKDGRVVNQNWSFPYYVGQPSGTISLPDLNLLFRGKENEIEGGATGYQDYTFTMTNGTVVKRNGKWYAKPGAGRNATISVIGIAGDKRVTLKTINYRVSPLPLPVVRLGGIKNGDRVAKSVARNNNRLFLYYEKGIPLDANLFKIASWEIRSSQGGSKLRGNGSTLTDKAKRLINASNENASISIAVKLKGGGTLGARNLSFSLK